LSQFITGRQKHDTNKKQTSHYLACKSVGRQYEVQYVADTGTKLWLRLRLRLRAVVWAKPLPLGVKN
jgi:hypothetical protein